MSELAAQPTVEEPKDQVSEMQDLGMTPVQPKERIAVADILRGFALLGVLMMNMQHFLGDYNGYNQLAGTLNRATWLGIRFFAQAKFYSMFSFLFGWGMAIQMLRAEERKAGFVWHYAKRLLVLLAIGIVHAIFIWQGDILNTYAVLGFTLLLLRKRSDKFLLVLAVICILIPVLISFPGPGEDFRDWYNQWGQELRQEVRAGYPAIPASGTYMDNVRHRIGLLQSGWTGFIYWGPHIIGMFIIGLYVGRRRLFENIDEHLPLFRKVMWGGLIIGIPLNILWVGTSAGLINIPVEWNQVAVRGARTVGASALCLAYVSIIILITRQRLWLNRLSALAPLGRTALSNYLLQSTTFTLIFWGYGLGGYGGRWATPFWGLVFTLVFYGIQISLSRWWMSRYLFGPAEWLWRTLTYGKIQPMMPEWRQQAREVAGRWSSRG
jgi:uncharacterized protein